MCNACGLDTTFGQADNGLARLILSGGWNRS